jgi:phenolphthiocerol/phthiocerol/phthiodiolone dimycocerosyl transferase
LEDAVTSSAIALRRRLDEIEVQHLGAAPGHAVQYSGRLDEPALRKAFDLLCDRHPVLCGVVRCDDQGHVLSVPPGHRPEFAVFDGDEGALVREVCGRWNSERGLARLVLVRGHGGGFVALRAGHAIVDRHSLGALFDQLWYFYDDVVRGRNVAAGPRATLPVPPSTLLRERWDPSCSPSTEIPAEYSPLLRRVVRPIEGYLRLGAAETERLLAAGRSARASVHALVSGAVLAAQRDSVPVPGEVMMACLSPVDLRTRVTPPVGATDTTVFVGVHRAEVGLARGADPVVVGLAVRGLLAGAIAARRLSIAAEVIRLIATPAGSALPQRLAMAQVSNSGIIQPGLARPGGLELVDFFMPADVVLATFPIYGVYSYQRRLSIRYLFPSGIFTAEEVEDVTARLHAHLLGIGAGHG